MKKIIVLVCITTIVNIAKALAQNNVLDSITELRQFTAMARVSDWEPVKQKQGVLVKYRKLNIGDTLKVRELSVHFTVNASLDSIVFNLKQPFKIEIWNEVVRESSLLKNGDSNWISHIIYNIPYPFSQQDLITGYTLKNVNKNIVITTRSLPGYIAPLKGVHRERFNLGQWVLSPDNSGKISVTFSAVSLSNAKIPRFIKDPIIQKKLLNSFIKLKNLLQNEKSD